MTIMSAGGDAKLFARVRTDTVPRLCHGGDHVHFRIPLNCVVSIHPSISAALAISPWILSYPLRTKPIVRCAFTQRMA